METVMIIGMIVVLVSALGYCMWGFYKDVKSTTNEELRQRAEELNIKLKYKE